jgi:hypothetical protein
VPSFELSPGVVVDTDRGEAYLMSPEGGIVAVGLADGEPAWRSSDLSKPLTLVGELLVGQGEAPGGADTLRIVTLDVAQGGRQVNETLVQLPPGVQSSIMPSLSRSFTAKALAEPQEAIVSWEFVERPLRGVPTGPLEVLPGEAPPGVSAAALPATGPPAPGVPGMPAASSTVEPGGEAAVVRGVARVDLATGTITATDETRLPAPPPDLPPGSAGDSAPASDLEPTAALPGVPEPQFLSADGRHVLSSLRVADDPAWDQYVWTIFERESGRRVGEMRMHLRYVPFFVEGTRVIYQTPPYERREGSSMRQEPLQLRAADLDSGAEVWHQPVRDTVDREPPPP